MKKIKNSAVYAFSLSALLCLFGGCGNNDKSDSAAIPTIKVHVAPLTEHTFLYKIKVQGSIKPIDDADISARISGVIDNINVSEGSKVSQGDILFQIDRKNLENQLSIAKQNLLVAQEICKTANEDIAIAEITLKKAEADYKRSKKLHESKVVSDSTFESDESTWKKAQATFRRQQAVYKYNQAQLKQAENNLQIAEKNLADSIIRAPYDGIITEKYHEEKEFASIGSKVLRIENQNALELNAIISSLYYNAIFPGTNLILSIDGQELCRSKVTYKAPMIDPLSRTFEIKSLLPRSAKAVSGSLCDIDIILAQRQGRGIPANAILSRAGGKFSVFIIENSKAREINVIPGFTSNGFTEIMNADILKNSEIVTSGHYFLNNNSTVEIIKGE